MTERAEGREAESRAALPEPALVSYLTDAVMRVHEVRSFTAAQMRAYRSAALEQAAEVCERRVRSTPYATPSLDGEAFACAAAIRVLK